jgi:hypothetical protein
MMSPRFSLAVLLSLLALALFACAPAPEQSTAVSEAESEAIQPEQTITLFDGSSLDGFYTYLRDNKFEDPKSVFTLADGLLRISGEEWGAITTRNEYTNYHLVAEWKWGDKTWGDRKEKARDSGILLHAVGPDDGGKGRFWMQSIEYQIIEGGTGDFILVAGPEKPSMIAEVRHGANEQTYWEKGGEKLTRDSGRFNWYARSPEWRDEINFRGEEDIENPVGEWNVSEVLCDGDSITAILNGKVVNYATGASQIAGKLQIQSEGAEIFFRKIELRPITQEVRAKYTP